MEALTNLIAALTDFHPASAGVGTFFTLLLQYGWKFYGDYTARRAASEQQKREIDAQLFKHVEELTAEIKRLKGENK